MHEHSERSIVLELRGSRAQYGVPLGAFETFIENFLKALRDFDRSARMEPTRPTGHPTAHAERITAFRLVGFRPGSGIATLEPILEHDEEEDSLAPGMLTLAEMNLRAFVSAIRENTLDEPTVLDEIEEARRALGEDGRFRIQIGGGTAHMPVLADIDAATVERLARGHERRAPRMQLISGRLHLIDLEPGKVGIRSPTGIDWTCQYPAELEPHVMSLLGTNVWARGMGSATGRRGTLEIHEIQPVLDYEQTSFFAVDRLPVDVLAERQGVPQPQGLDSLADPEWEDNEESRRYLDALFGS
jgi:hypothetical protein